MQKQRSDKTYNERFTVIIALCVALVMVISFVVALTKFADSNDAESSVDASSETESSSAVIEESSVADVEVSAPSYEYYDSIEFTDITVNNSDVVNGSLSIIKNDSSAFPVIDSSKTVGVHEVKTADVYGLSGYNLKIYREAIENIDRFIVSFYNEVPDNGLIIDKALIAPNEADAEKGTIDLATGYSVKFTIYGSSYSFSDAEFSYLSEQSYRYGVIQRYPEGKKTHTGYEADSTLYRYVGLAHSYYMNYYKISLEEYIDKLRTQKVVEFKSGLEDNVAYVIYYVPVDDTSSSTNIPIPADEAYTYTISGDGSKGFVVTVKLAVS